MDNVVLWTELAEVIRAKAPKAKDFINKAVNAKNRNESRICAPVEYSTGEIKRVRLVVP